MTQLENPSWGRIWHICVLVLLCIQNSIYLVFSKFLHTNDKTFLNDSVVVGDQEMDSVSQRLRHQVKYFGVFLSWNFVLLFYFFVHPYQLFPFTILTTELFFLIGKINYLLIDRLVVAWLYLAIKYFYCKCHAMISKMHNFCRSVRDSSIYKNNKYAIFGQPRLCRKKHFILKFNANKRVCLEEKNYTHLIIFWLFFP